MEVYFNIFHLNNFLKLLVFYDTAWLNWVNKHLVTFAFFFMVRVGYFL